jgi:hypothetical protein
MGHHAPPLESVCSVGVIIVTYLACAGLLRATDGSRREEYVTDDALRQEWMRV